LQFTRQLNYPSEEVGRQVSFLVNQDTWIITDTVWSQAAAYAIEKKQPSALKIVFKDDGMDHQISLDHLSRVFERSSCMIDVTLKFLDSFYTIKKEGFKRDTKILSMCLSSDK